MNTVNKNIKILYLLVLFLELTLIVNAQTTLQVSGVILSSANKPISGVSVVVSETTDMPVVSDINGRFKLELETLDKDLIITAPQGYKPKTIALNGRTEIKVYLTRQDLYSQDDDFSAKGLDLKRKDVVASYTDINIIRSTEAGQVTIDQYMSGRIAGVQTTRLSGKPNSPVVFEMHGLNSINANDQPLFIVDGIPVMNHGIFTSNVDGNVYNPLVFVNPSDVSRISLIKDPAFTVAWGSKASNGVVIIETLDPSSTETSISIDINSGYSMAPDRLIPQMNAVQHKTYIHEQLFTLGLTEEIIEEWYPNLYLQSDDERFIDYQHNTNWQDQIFSNSSLYNLNLQVKGGDEIAQYGLSFGYQRNNGIIKETNYEAYNLRFVSALNIFKWMKMDAGVAFNYNLSSLKESAQSIETSPVLSSLAKSPLLNPFQYDAEGNEIKEFAQVDELGVSNPLAVIKNYSALNTNYYFITKLGLEADIRKDLLLRTNVGLTYNALKEQVFMPNKGMELYDNSEAYNIAKFATNTFTSLYNNSFLKYKKDFGKHKIQISAGWNLQNNVYQYDFAKTANAHPNDEYRRLQDGTNNLRELDGRNRKWNWLSFYDALAYSYHDRYLLNASISLDGSSRVGKNAKNTLKIGDSPYGLFYAVGIGWNVSAERFLNQLSWLELFQFRAGFSKSGNDDIGEVNATKYYQSIRYNSTVGLYPAVLHNDVLTYETTRELNGGLDLAFLGNRFSLKVDLYKRNIDDLLIYVPQNAYLGYNFRPENNGAMVNNGVDISAFLRVVDLTNFKWDIQPQFSKVTNSITSIKNNQLITEIAGGEVVSKVGFAANSFYGYIYKGVYASNTEAEYANLINDRGLPFAAGDAIFEDISGPEGVPDFIINHYDKTIIGSSMPDYSAGLINTFSYKNIKLSVLLTRVVGNDIFNYLRFKNESGNGLGNQSVRMLNRWQYQGQNTDIPRAQMNDPIGNSDFSTRWIEDGSFFRVGNIAFSYLISKEFLGFKNAMFYLTANNVYTFSNYLGYSPEVGYTNATFTRGVDYGLAPQSRQFIIGVKLGL